MTFVPKTARGADTVQQAFIPKPPDGGWGWIVVFGSFMIHVLADGVTYSFGIFFTEFLDEFKSGKGLTSWIGSILVGVTYGSGPLASGLTNRYGCRVVTIVGGLIAAAGCVLSYFATSVYFLMFSFGGITGLGFGLIYLPAIVSVTMYFEKKRAFATGVAVCGSGVGTFVMAPVIKVLVNHYKWRGAMLILGALTLNNCLFGALFRPLDVVKEPYIDLDGDDAVLEEEVGTELCDADDAETMTESKSLGTSAKSSVRQPDVTDEDDVVPVVLLRHVQGSDTTAAASMPLIISRSEASHGIARRARSRDSAAANKLALQRGKLLEQQRLGNSHGLAREFSDGGTAFRNATTGNNLLNENDAEFDNTMLTAVDPFNISSYTKSDTHLAVPLTPTKKAVSNRIGPDLPQRLKFRKLLACRLTCAEIGVFSTCKQSDVVRNFDSHHSLAFGRSRNTSSTSAAAAAGRRSSSGGGSGSPRRRYRHPRYMLDRHPDINLDLIFSDGIGSGKNKSERRTYLAPFSRRDAFFQGSILDLDEYKSAPKLYDVNILNIRPISPSHSVLHTVDDDDDDGLENDFAVDSKAAVSNRDVLSGKPTAELSSTENGVASLHSQQSLKTLQKLHWWQKFPEIMRQMLDLSLLKDPVYLLFAISNFLTSIGFNAPYTFLPDRVDKEYGALIVMIIGIANTIGRVVLGILSDKKYVNRLYLYNTALSLCGIFTALSVCSSHFYWLATYAALFGASMGCYVSLTSVILVDLLSLEKLTNAFGLLLLFQGIASLIGAPLVGWIYDATKSYELPFILLGIVIFLSGAMLFVIPLVRRRKQRAQQHTQTTLSDRWSVDENATDVPNSFPGDIGGVSTSATRSSNRSSSKSAKAGPSAGQPRRKRNVSFADDNCVSMTTRTKVDGDIDIHRM